MVLLASAHETRRACDTDTPVALAREQRMSVMLESVRMALLASKTTLMMDLSGDDEVVSLSVLSPTPRPMASAAMMARRRQHGQYAPSGRFLSLFTSSALVGAEEGASGVGARMVRPSPFDSVIRFPGLPDTTTGLSPTGSNSTFSEDAILGGDELALRIGREGKGGWKRVGNEGEVAR